jgi:uncharacterized protein YqfA (UPF0365 family)
MGATAAIVNLSSDSTQTVTTPTITGLAVTSVTVKSSATTGIGLAVGSLVGGDSGTIAAKTDDVTLDKNTTVDGAK